MNIHVKFVLLVVGLVALAVLVVLLRADTEARGESPLMLDIFLGVLAAGFAGATVSYVMLLRRRPTTAAGEAAAGEELAGEASAGEAPGGERRAAGLERLLGRKRGRLLGIVLLSVMGVAVLFAVVLVAYMLYLQVFLGSP